VKVLDLFSGIGGFSLGLESTGFFETVAFCEKDDFCKKVLQKHWGDIKIYDDIRSVDDEIQADVVTGGFPCQSFSQAGLQKGRADDRFLWNEMFDVIKKVRPRWVIGENVQGIINIEEGMVLRQVQDDLASEGFGIQCFLIPASGIGAWHQRNRVWILANNISQSDSIRHRRGDNERCANEQWTFLPREQEGREMGSKTKRCSNVSKPKSIGQESSTYEEKQARNTSRHSKGKSERSSTRNVPNSKSKRLQGFSNDSSSLSTEGKKSKSRTKDSYEADATDTFGFGTQGEDAREHSGIKLHNSTSTERETWWQTESRVCGVPDGVSYGVDRDRAKRIKALGNSIVPQIARQLGLAIMEAENES